MNNQDLVAKVISTTDRPNREKSCNYYMLNINHPVIAALKRLYCAAQGIRPYIPMSDQERTEFELWLFKPLVRQIIENICTGRSDNQLGSEISSNLKNEAKK